LAACCQELYGWFDVGTLEQLIDANIHIVLKMEER